MSTLHFVAWDGFCYVFLCILTTNKKLSSKWPLFFTSFVNMKSAFTRYSTVYAYVYAFYFRLVRGIFVFFIFFSFKNMDSVCVIMNCLSVPKFYSCQCISITLNRMKRKRWKEEKKCHQNFVSMSAARCN